MLFRSLEVFNIKPFSVRSYKSYLSKDNDFVINIGYSCEAKSEKVELNWEHDDYKWLTKDEAMKLDLTDAGKFFINNL